MGRECSSVGAGPAQHSPHRLPPASNLPERCGKGTRAQRHTGGEWWAVLGGHC